MYQNLFYSPATREKCCIRTSVVFFSRIRGRTKTCWPGNSFNAARAECTWQLDCGHKCSSFVGECMRERLNKFTNWFDRFKVNSFVHACLPLVARSRERTVARSGFSLVRSVAFGVGEIYHFTVFFLLFFALCFKLIRWNTACCSQRHEAPKAWFLGRVC